MYVHDSISRTKLLIADDDAAQRAIVRACLPENAYEVTEAVNGAEALECLQNDPEIRLVILDLNMPEVSGFDVIRSLREDDYRYRYVIVLTSADDDKQRFHALSLGANDFLTKPVIPEELELRLIGGKKLLSLETQEEVILSLAKLAEFRSVETGSHLDRVRQYTKLLAFDLAENEPSMKITPQMASEIARVSALHDIGKVSIPDQILHKPGKLTDEEFTMMKTHAEHGGQILLDIYHKTSAQYLYIAYELTNYHHERYNGKGYPSGLAGEDIPVSARIMALADVYDAMASNRCYKTAEAHEVIRTLILKESGEHFDPRVVEAFLRQEDKWKRIAAAYPK